MKRDKNNTDLGLKKGQKPNPLGGCHNDNSNDNFTPLEYQTLNALQTHNTLTHISTALNCNKSNTHRTLKKLIKDGVVEQHQNQYILSGKGNQLLRNRSCHSLYGSQSLTTTQRIQCVRGHRISFNVLLRPVPDGWGRWLNTCCGLSLPESSPYYPMDFKRVVDRYALVEGWKNYKPLNVFLSNGFSLRVHTKGVMVHIPEVIGDSASEVAETAFRRLVAILPKLERWLKLPPTSLYKNGRLSIKMVTSEYALIKNVFAKAWIKSKRGRERFMVEGDNGELRLLVDMSPPFKFEFEAVHPVESESDTNVAQPYFRDVIDGKALRPSVVKERLEGITSLINDQLTPVLKDFTVQMKGHVGTAKGLNKGSHALVEAANASASVANAMKELVMELRGDNGGVVVDVSKKWRGK